ncbi:MAG: metal ABC transporter substrate-binding protein [Chloroflexota bacterium]
MFRSILNKLALAALGLSVAACATPPISTDATPKTSLRVLAIETFLADIAQNVAGTRTHVDTLIPQDVDPHEFEPTPTDVRKIADSQVLIVNGAKLEEFLDELLANAGGKRSMIEASAGLKSRTPTANEILDPDHPGDPHFWLDPNNVIRYVENIRDGLSQADPAGAAAYKANAEAYIAQLKILNTWIVNQVKPIPPERRLLVTNHESFGYYADRYGFKIVGTIVPSVSSGVSPSAQQLAALVNQIKATQAPAIFLETGTNPQLAQQLAQETGTKVVTGLCTHSTTDFAPTYLKMMEYNTNAIVDALK